MIYPSPTPIDISPTTTQHFTFTSIKLFPIIILPIEKALNKSKKIQKAAEAYKNDENLIIRSAAAIYNVHHSLISNYLNNETKPAHDCYTSYQKRILIKENILAQYTLRAYNSDFPLIIRHLMIAPTSRLVWRSG